ncbi:hypothetical protein DFS34DRAFT_277060 [Phlyctochytrium arcticum]|nr:hypothetical protein DFS34DRAFT_277060 [Phlyctochytrium arcticum]
MAEVSYTECPWSFSVPIPLSAPLKPWLQIPLPSWVGFGNQGCVQYPPRRRHPTMNPCSLHHSQTAMPKCHLFSHVQAMPRCNLALGLGLWPREFAQRFQLKALHHLPTAMPRCNVFSHAHHYQTGLWDSAYGLEDLPKYTKSRDSRREQRCPNRSRGARGSDGFYFNV